MASQAVLELTNELKTEIIKNLRRKRTYGLNVGDVHECNCPNCEHPESVVILVLDRLMTVRCLLCKHVETIERPMALRV
jgi:hypothetical protein